MRHFISIADLSRQACGPASQRSQRRSRFGLVVPRVTVPMGEVRATGPA